MRHNSYNTVRWKGSSGQLSRTGASSQFFNTFLKPDLAAKRILKIDLLAFNTETEFEQPFEQLWQLSRERMTQPAGVSLLAQSTQARHCLA